MKKITTLLLIAMVLLLCGCEMSGDSSGGTSSGGSSGGDSNTEQSSSSYSRTQLNIDGNPVDIKVENTSRTSVNQ